MDYRSWIEKSKSGQDVAIEVALFLILGFLIGFTIKTQATRTMTIGFDDYKIKESRQAYDLDAIKKAFYAEAARQQAQDAPLEDAASSVSQ